MIGRNAHYYIDSATRSEHAKEHTSNMEKYYLGEILECVGNTKRYGLHSVFSRSSESPRYTDTKVLVYRGGTPDAIRHYSGQGKLCALNFASYKNPGGKFLDGSKAQEECLCHESYLHNVLNRCPEYYDWNNNHKNRALYFDTALYSPSIKFMGSTVKNSGYPYYKDIKQVSCDIITCAAPNIAAARRFRYISPDENNRVCASRIKFILDIAVDNLVDTLILGAFGCGVFGQNPTEIATITRELLYSIYGGRFNQVVLAIPIDRTNNLECFERVFGLGV